MKHILQILFLVIAAIGSVPARADAPAADLDNSGTVNLNDFSTLAAAWTDSLPWWPDGQIDQMVAHWAFDQDVTDSRFVFESRLIGSPAWMIKRDNPENVKIGSGAIGLYGPAYIEAEAARFPPFCRSFTLDVWLRTNFRQQSQTIITTSSAAWQLGIERATGKAFFSCPGLSGAVYLSSNTSLADDAWHHIAAVYDCDSEQIVLYVDGSVDAQASASGQPSTNTSVLWIGYNPLTSDGQLHGILDNLRIFNCALSAAQIFGQQTWHVNALGGTDGPGPEWGKGRQQAFQTIQYAIDRASDGDTILVWPGLYRESLFFMGKQITIRSAADAAWLMPNPHDSDQVAVTFMYGEQSDSIMEHFVILSSSTALWIHQSSPTLRHLTIVNNDVGLQSIFNASPRLDHCIFWNNTEDIVYDTYVPEISFSCLQSGWPGQGNISADPLFANAFDPNAYDFHLQSETGRFRPGGPSAPQRPIPQNWVMDGATSPCVDAGSPQVDPYRETMLNGGRINMGACGNTPFASLSPWALPADLDRSGRVHVEDILLFAEHWLETIAP